MRVSPQTGTAGRVRRLAADLATTLAATTGTALALSGEPESLAVLTLALLGVALRAVFMRRGNPTRHLLTTQTTQRALLGAGCGVALVALSPTTVEMVGAALGTLLVTGSLMYEPYQHAGAQLRVPFVAHLPGLEDTQPRRDLTRHVLVANRGRGRARAGDRRAGRIDLVVGPGCRHPGPAAGLAVPGQPAHRGADRPVRTRSARCRGRVRAGIRALHLVALRRVAPGDDVAAVPAAVRAPGTGDHAE